MCGTSTPLAGLIAIVLPTPPVFARTHSISIPSVEFLIELSMHALRWFFTVGRWEAATRIRKNMQNQKQWSSWFSNWLGHFIIWLWAMLVLGWRCKAWLHAHWQIYSFQFPEVLHLHSWPYFRDCTSWIEEAISSRIQKQYKVGDGEVFNRVCVYQKGWQLLHNVLHIAR